MYRLMPVIYIFLNCDNTRQKYAVFMKDIISRKLGLNFAIIVIFDT